MHGPKYFICFLTNILLRSERFTEQSYSIENKFLQRKTKNKNLNKFFYETETIYFACRNEIKLKNV